MKSRKNMAAKSKPAKAAPVRTTPANAAPAKAAQPKIVHVPETDRGAFNPQRNAGKLLKSQTVHLREALIKHLHELTAVLAIDLGSLKTEGDVSDYIHRVTAILHPHGARHDRKSIAN
jgi:hypothetical protein